MVQTEEWITIHTNQFAQQLCHDLPDPFGLVLSEFMTYLIRLALYCRISMPCFFDVKTSRGIFHWSSSAGWTCNGQNGHHFLWLGLNMF